MLADTDIHNVGISYSSVGVIPPFGTAEGAKSRCEQPKRGKICQYHGVCKNVSVWRFLGCFGLFWRVSLIFLSWYRQIDTDKCQYRMHDFLLPGLFFVEPNVSIATSIEGQYRTATQRSPVELHKMPVWTFTRILVPENKWRGQLEAACTQCCIFRFLPFATAVREEAAKFNYRRGHTIPTGLSYVRL